MGVRCGQAPACPWTGTFGQRGQNLIDHDAHCPLKELRCDRCGESLLRRAAAVHVQRECRDRVVVCRACVEPMRLGTAADHQPALQPLFAAHDRCDVKEEAQMHEDGGVQAAVAAPEAAAASSSAAAVAPAEPVRSPQLRLPPVVPPCIDAELCPRGCESVDHPGSVSNRARRGEETH